MSEVMQQGLMITIIGMGLVFAVIIFLWWLMGLLVRATTREVKEQTVDLPADDIVVEHLVPEMADIEKQRRAAAAAVAVRLALAQSRAYLVSGDPQAGTGAMSPWQSMHRARQLERQHKRG
jgi:Na+-transporting methylmalonyl-CoA/oxaloacetate decarboxylase gamma subunit